MNGTPVIILGIAIILIALAVVAFRNMGKLKQPFVRNKKWFLLPFITGLVLALTAAFFMFDGDILGLRERRSDPIRSGAGGCQELFHFQNFVATVHV